MITIDDFAKIDMRIGKIKSAEKIPDTNKLLKLRVDFGVEERQIVSGIAEYFTEPEILIGKHCAFVVNLEPRRLKGEESQGMLLALKSEDGLHLLEVSGDVLPGIRIS